MVLWYDGVMWLRRRGGTVYRIATYCGTLDFLNISAKPAWRFCG